MYCQKCGKELKKTSKYCTECGTIVDNNNNQNNQSVTPIQPTSTTAITQPNKSLAVASMVIGIISLFVGTIFAALPIVGLVLGLMYKGKCSEKTAGIVLNIISLVITILFTIFFIIFITTANSNTEYDYNRYYYDNSDTEINDDLDYYNDYNDYEEFFNY
jgi:hypothetical protein